MIDTEDARREWLKIRAHSTERLRRAGDDMALAVRGVTDAGTAQEIMRQVLADALDELSETAG